MLTCYNLFTSAVVMRHIRSMTWLVTRKSRSEEVKKDRHLIQESSASYVTRSFISIIINTTSFIMIKSEPFFIVLLSVPSDTLGWFPSNLWHVKLAPSIITRTYEQKL
jgi:hypothetical protein